MDKWHWILIIAGSLLGALCYIIGHIEGERHGRKMEWSEQMLKKMGKE
jgi:hypothetical protein